MADLEDIVAETQALLGPHVKKPALTAKLLSRPPFKFLHDVFEVVMKKGAFAGLYTDAEMNIEGIKKPQKIEFLQKMIDAAGLAVGKTIRVKAKAIVTGSEPERTNSLLQALGKVLSEGIDTSGAVQQVVGGGGSERAESAKAKSRPSKSDREKSASRGDDGEKKRKSRRSERSSDKPDREGSASRDRERRSKRREDREDKDSRSGRDKERKHRSKDKDCSRDRRSERRETEPEPQQSETEPEPAPQSMPERPVTRNGRPGSARPGSARAGGRRTLPKPKPQAEEEVFPDAPHAEEQAQDAEEDQFPMPAAPEPEDDLPSNIQKAVRRRERPSSARPAPPRKRRDNADDTQAGPVAEPVQVIADEHNDDDAEDMFIVEDTPVTVTPVPTAEVEEDDGEDGALMREIKKKKAETQGDDIDGTARVNEEAQRKEREQIEKEITVLRDSIQTLCRSANPLGKVIDYMQEDVDSMRKELQMWQTENAEHSQSLLEETSNTDNTLLPLRTQLRDLDQQIEDQEAKIRAQKAATAANDQKIQRMLSSVAFAAKA